MSIATDSKVADLEKRIVEIEQKLLSMTRVETVKHMAQLELRLERLEQRGRPGAKAKDGANG